MHCLRPAFAPLLLLGLLTPLAVAAPWPVEDTRFTSPPGEETPEVASLIQRAAGALAAGATTTDLLVDPLYLPAHEWPRFRDLIRDHAGSSRARIVTPGEEGEPLVVTGTGRLPDGSPAKQALMYVYQTSARGWYSDRAAHVTGMGGDTRHARLFGYLRTDVDGSYEIRTIRPAGYPGSELPAHIHVQIQMPDEATRGLVSEIVFDDDPRLTPAAREESRRAGFAICAVSRDGAGLQRARADFTLR